jgi:hypothetical protein
MESMFPDQSATGSESSGAKAMPTVIEEYISILREIKAPVPLIEIAERVAAATPAPPQKK